MTKNLRLLVKFNWLVLVFIYLVVIAGSLVRITGSGMGCPDWPRCFGEWVPPTDEAQLEIDYQEIYLTKRQQKIEKFAQLLEFIGLQSTAKKLLEDPTLLQEEPFNAQKTWIEYGNRWFGFLAGNSMLIAFLWMLFVFRKKKVVIVSIINLLLMAFQAWFGSIVVASNLVPWTITVHLFLALLIIALQLRLIYLMSPKLQEKTQIAPWMKVLLWVTFLIIFYQLFLGTQVREAVDALVKQGYSRSEWVGMLGLPFFIHRSFSWLVLILLSIIAWKNEKAGRIRSIRIVYGFLAVELVSGILLSYIDMPGLVQTAHLLFATIIFGILTVVLFRITGKTSNNKQLIKP